MTNILSTLRGSGFFCVKLVRNTSKLLSSFFNFYNTDQVLSNRKFDSFYIETKHIDSAKVARKVQFCV